jgi:hypothetical protein
MSQCDLASDPFTEILGLGPKKNSLEPEIGQCNRRLTLVFTASDTFGLLRENASVKIPNQNLRDWLMVLKIQIHNG